MPNPSHGKIPFSLSTIANSSGIVWYFDDDMLNTLVPECKLCRYGWRQKLVMVRLPDAFIGTQ